MVEDAGAYNSIAERYKPLSPEEEKALIASMRHDEARLRELLVYHNVSAAFAVGRKYATSRMDSPEDGIQRAMIGLHKASQSYNLDSGVRFLTYAAWQMIASVRYMYRDELKDAKMNQRLVSLDEPISVRINALDGDELTRLEAIRHFVSPDLEVKNDGSETYEVASSGDILELVLATAETLTRFSPRRIDMFKRYVTAMMSGDSERSVTGRIAAELGVSGQAIRAAVDDVKKCVKRKMAACYSQEEEVAALLVSHRKHERDVAWQSPAYRDVTCADEKLIKEAAHIEAVKNEKSIRDALKDRLKSKLYHEAFAEQKLSPEAAKAAERKDRHGWHRVATVNYNRFLPTQKARRNLVTHWHPESLNRRLRELYAHERQLERLRHPVIAAHGIGEQRRLSLYRSMGEASVPPPAVPSAAVPMPKRDEAETTEEIITDEIRERLARIEERQISMGNHSDDQHELREAD